MRKRIDYTKTNGKPKQPIYYTEEIPCPIYYEEWKLIDLEGIRKNFYYASTTGKVMNRNGLVLKPNLINSGYYTYRLYDEKGICRHILAHRLFMMVFNPVENMDQLTVNHKDLDTENNFMYNLEWNTQLENNMHSYGTGNYQAKFNIDQLKIIINELAKSTKYKDILNILGIEDTWNNRDYIGNIKRGITYKREINEILNG